MSKQVIVEKTQHSSCSLTSEELAGLLQGRFFIYDLLVRCIGQPPDAASFAELTAQPLFDALNTLSPAASRFCKSARQVAHDPSLLQEAVREHERLYVGSTGLSVPVWESVVQEKEGLLFGTCTLEVRRWYAKYGLVFSRKENEPDDHLAIELEFMACLAMLTLQRRAKQQPLLDIVSDQETFLHQHVLAWIPHVLMRQKAFVHTAFYADMLDFAHEFLHCDGETILLLKEAILHEETH